MTTIAKVWDNVVRIRENGPLVHSITNYVVMNNTANALLATGASPIMAHAVEEMDELVAISSALVINIGTLSKPWIESMFVAGKAALAHNKPLILDPVGAGASRLRTETSMQILKGLKPAVVRGNASEIMALAGADVATKGVDSTHATIDAVGAAKKLATTYDCTVVVSGEQDIISSKEGMITVTGGHAMMPRVTGMGCTATVMVGAHVAVAETPFEGAVSAMAVMSAAGGAAATKAQGTGSFQMHFLDALYNLTQDDLRQYAGIAL